MKEKKNNKGFHWIIVILLVIILALLGFIIYDKVLYKEQTNNKSITTKINNDDEKVLRRDNFVYKLNDKDYQISYLYKKKDSKEFELWKKNLNNNEIKNNNKIYNMIYLEILLNEKKVDIEIPLSYNYKKSSKDDVLKNIHLFSSNTINTLKGKNSEYLVFSIEHANPYVDGGVDPFIVNEKGQVIHTIEFQDNTGWWTTDESSIMYDNGEYYLTNDTLYYLLPNCEKVNEYGLYFDEFSLKIENDRVVIEKQGTFKGAAAGGAVCGG